MGYKVNFYIDKQKDKSGKLIGDNAQIFLYFSFDGNRLKYFTGHRIDFSKWDEVKQRVKKNNLNKAGETASFINGELNNIQTTVTDIYETARALKQTPTVQSIKDELKKRLGKVAKPSQDESLLFNRYQKYIDEAKVSPLRRKQITSTMNHFKRFVQNDKLTFENVTRDTLKDFRAYLENDPNAPKGKNTVVCILKKLRAFFNYAVKEEWTTNASFVGFVIDQERYGDPIYLTKEERNLLFDADLSNVLRLERTRDIFVFQCLIGCRVGDLIRLTKDNIINGAVEYVPNKTKEEKQEPVRVMLSPKAKEILSRYDLPDGKLLPFISGQKYNDYIKELFDFVGLHRSVIRLNPLTGQEETVRLCDIASSHMGRRSFIGILHRTVKNEVIASMSGHVANSKAFARYYAIDDQTKNEAINNLD